MSTQKGENTLTWKAIMPGLIIVPVLGIAGPFFTNTFSLPKYCVVPSLLLLTGLPIYYVSFMGVSNRWTKDKKNWTLPTFSLGWIAYACVVFVTLFWLGR